jgi:predicted DNA-binding transcriptional regulator AlpA
MLSQSERLLQLSDVKDLVGFRSSWIYEQMAAGRFPRPVKIGFSSRWLASDIQKWITSQRPDSTVQAIHELVDAVNDARNAGISNEAIQAALGPISLDHEDGVAHTRAQAERVKGLR